MKSLNNLTWGEFIDAAARLGVEVRTLNPAPEGLVGLGYFLYRKLGTNEMWVPLPSDFDLGQKIGVFRFESVCRRLSIDDNFMNLPVIL